MKTKSIFIALLSILPQLAFAQNPPTSEEVAKAKAAQDAAMAKVEQQEIAHKVPPILCNSNFARQFMVKHVAERMFIPPEKIASIGTLGGAGGEGGAEGDPGDKNYSSHLSCPIRITFVGGGQKFVTYNERFSVLYGEEVALSTFPADPNDPALQWIDTRATEH